MPSPGGSTKEVVTGITKMSGVSKRQPLTSLKTFDWLTNGGKGNPAQAPGATKPLGDCTGSNWPRVGEGEPEAVALLLFLPAVPEGIVCRKALVGKPETVV